jgi:AcrR family transcriptional regulator
LPESKAKDRTASAKSIRTRQRLLDAGRDVFVQKGFTNARVSDIADAAGASHGTFYTYFESKHDIFRVLALESIARIESTTEDIWSINLPPDQAMGKVMEAWVTAYQAEAPIMTLIESAGPQAGDLGQRREELSRGMIERSIEVVERFQRTGLADGSLDAACAATALTVMVQSLAQRMSTGPQEFEMPLVITTLSRIWQGAIGLRLGTPR